MFTTSSLYFLVAIFGESIKTSEAHALQLVQGQEDEPIESGHNEEQEAAETHNESGESPGERLQEQHELNENTGESTHIEGGEETEHNEEGEETGESIHDEASENQRRVFEPPLTLTAGVGYAAIGFWMILDKRNTKIPYAIVIVGSLILLGVYFASRTTGISTLGTEPFGIFDISVAGIQVAIIATSMLVLAAKIYTKGKTVGK